MHRQGDSFQPKKTGIRVLRQILDSSFPIVGVLVILGAVLFERDINRQIAIVGIGIVILEAGVWRLPHRLLPSERKFLALRAEVDCFLLLIRHLNAVALQVKAHKTPENRQRFEDIRETMRQAVERMAVVAGKTNTELAAEHNAIGQPE